MDFSLGKNSLDHYINFDSSGPSESDSFRSIKDYNKLESYLSQKKEENDKLIDVLITAWRNYGQRFSDVKLLACNCQRVRTHQTVELIKSIQILILRDMKTCSLIVSNKLSGRSLQGLC